MKNPLNSDKRYFPRKSDIPLNSDKQRLDHFRISALQNLLGWPSQITRDFKNMKRQNSNKTWESAKVVEKVTMHKHLLNAGFTHQQKV